MNGAELLVAALENEGVGKIFGVPGEENLDVLDALRRSSVQLILTRHEQAAAFMAATHGRLTGEAGVCLSIPGALNLTTGAAYAQLGAMPMVMITGQKGVLSRKQARFQVVNMVSTMTPLTKMSRQIVSGGTIPSVVREAFRIAQQERPAKAIPPTWSSGQRVDAVIGSDAPVICRARRSEASDSAHRIADTLKPRPSYPLARHWAPVRRSINRASLYAPLRMFGFALCMRTFVGINFLRRRISNESHQRRDCGDKSVGWGMRR